MDKELQEEKKRLREESLQYRKAIQEQFDSTIDRAEDAGRNLLLATGIIIISYGVLALFTSGGKSKQKPQKKVLKEVPPEEAKHPDTEVVYTQPAYPRESPVIRLVKEHATHFAMNFLREKLTEFLDDFIQKQKEKRGKS